MRQLDRYEPQAPGPAPSIVATTNWTNDQNPSSEGATRNVELGTPWADGLASQCLTTWHQFQEAEEPEFQKLGSNDPTS